MELTDKIQNIIDVLTVANATVDGDDEGAGRYSKALSELIATRNLSINYEKQKDEEYARLDKLKERKESLASSYGEQMKYRNEKKQAIAARKNNQEAVSDDPNAAQLKKFLDQSRTKKSLF